MAKLEAVGLRTQPKGAPEARKIFSPGREPRGKEYRIVNEPPEGATEKTATAPRLSPHEKCTLEVSPREIMIPALPISYNFQLEI